MSMIAEQDKNTDTAPDNTETGKGLRKHKRRATLMERARAHPDPLVRRNVAHWRGRVDPAYLDDAYERTPEGRKAAPMPENIDTTYRATTTDAELAPMVDAQLIATPGTGAARIEVAGRFTHRTRIEAAPAMGLEEILALEPFRVYRALAVLLEEDYIHSPYLQLADHALGEHERTDSAAARLTAADEEFPAEQMSLDYKSLAERLMEASVLADEQDDPETEPAPAERPDTSPELIYTPTSQDYDQDGRLNLPALDSADTDAWWEVHLQGRSTAYVALADELVNMWADELVDMWADEPWDADLTLDEADLLADPHDFTDHILNTNQKENA